MTFDCVLQAWHDHQAELRGFLIGQVKEPAMADDVLQDVFFKAMREGRAFCELQNPRAWLFRVARNALTDSHRLRKHWVPVRDHLPDERAPERAPVDELDACIAATLPDLAESDRDIIQACDLGPMSQEAYADARGLSLPAAKARIRRARERLREALAKRCDVVLDSAGNVCCHAGLDDARRCFSTPHNRTAG
ncbi:sigma-70 family RNA polymerase sigma factor [Marinobacter lutaoensis]|jgi:RNA polymerase sigma-70 factor (ECF subfamily)|uniref:sigma-70 family RNA polymerase sigma factor n=1 Tax=Marinobacter lutaoensis TaxID=135739 RepID=UPI000C097D4C|nr:sigma-70 family RNA polymerase sigma factor [Marinobacter lutaoensis]MBE02110.1 RNA polymerase subunit sigma-70 [Marinobacter sp.]MBI42820.1 RNA polymerase subunit sigma-70 [Oceanospirillales bacterium]NVD36479.1 sigma-70 family RNA polymerase sigma factor [Marinobacter lutaoensis]|tara:strand:- start:5684 stop:6262 length:579 start_codon:yes stop_codon:yes gene_type:complete